MISENIKKAIQEAESLEKLHALKKEHFDNVVANLLKELSETKEPENKKEIGKKLNQYKIEFTELFEKSKNAFIKAKNEEIVDISLHNHNLNVFSNNLLSSMKEELIEFFKNLSFEISFGNSIVNEDANFNWLLIDKNHPSRSESETFYLKNNNLLRTHCTSNTVIQLKKTTNKNIPFKLITIGPVYRKDDSDSRHTEQFTQADIVWVDKELNLGTLKWFISSIFKHIFGQNAEFRFRNSFFPFTNPSFEVDMKCACQKKQSCSICSSSGWIEIMGCGMLHRKILKNSNYSEEFEAIAGGIGIERLILIKYALSDIRNLYKNHFPSLKHDC